MVCPVNVTKMEAQDAERVKCTLLRALATKEAVSQLAESQPDDCQSKAVNASD